VDERLDEWMDELMGLVDEVVVWCAPSPVWAETDGAASDGEWSAVREGQEVRRG
jgi:hypothetical protein